MNHKNKTAYTASANYSTAASSSSTNDTQTTEELLSACLISSSQMKTVISVLDERIEEAYQRTKVDGKYVKRTKATFEELKRVLLLSPTFAKRYSHNGGFSLRMFGSSVNGLASRESSDLDITFLHSDFGLSHQDILIDIKLVIERYGEERFKIKQNTPRLESSGYILQLKEIETGMDIDILVNKICELSNSRLVSEYAKIDQRFCKVMAYLK